MNNPGLILIIILIICSILLIYLIFNRLDKSLNINDSCKKTRFGCCSDKLTPKLDQIGTNCVPRNNIKEVIHKYENNLDNLDNLDTKYCNISKSVIIAN